MGEEGDMLHVENVAISWNSMYFMGYDIVINVFQCIISILSMVLSFQVNLSPQYYI